MQPVWIDTAYSALASVAVPLAYPYFAARGERARFAAPVPPFDAPPLWFHACSLGEVNTAAPFVEAAQRRWPRVPLLVTTSTRTGMEQAAARLPAIPRTWLPVDHPTLVRRFIRALRPRALALLETELWPGLLRSCAELGVPVVLINGRLGPKHIRRYMRVRRAFRPTVQRLSLAVMQTERYAERMADLGLEGGRIAVAGNAKFDGARTEIPERERNALWESLQLRPGTPLLVFGSTRPGDEALAAQCWDELAGTFPDLQLLVVPRHPDKRWAEVEGCFERPYALFSQLAAGAPRDEARVTLVDVTGQLGALYGLATVAVVGGSFSPGVEGHNPIEPAALGVPTVFGPYMANFEEAAATLVEAKGAVQTNAAALCEALRALLAEPAEAGDLGRRGQQSVQANRGAIVQTLDLLAPWVDPRAGH